MAAFVLALIRVRSVNLAQIAGAHRLQLPPLPEVPGRVQLRPGNHRTADPAQNPEQKLVLSLDRTEWKLGRRSINLLFIGVAHQGVAYPLVGCFLGKAGSSNLRERLGLLRRLLTFLPKARIQSLCADREFACTGPALAESALHPAHQSGEPGHLQGPKPTRPAVVPASGEALPKPVRLWGQPTYCGRGSTCFSPRPIPSRPLLDTPGAGRSKPSSNKTQGFDFESTHLTRAERVESLIAWMSIALVWAHQVGEWLSRTKPIPIKTRARKLCSTFRYGLDYQGWGLSRTRRENSPSQG